MAQDVSSIMLLESKENFGIKCFSFSYLTLFMTGNSDFVLVEGKTKYPYIYQYLNIHIFLFINQLFNFYVIILMK